MKLLFISPRYSGGIGGHAAMLADQLRKHGFHVDFLDPPKIPIKNFKNPSFVVTSSISSFFKGSYDIVHAFNVPSAFAMRTACAKKRVLSIHGVFSDQVNILHSSALGKVAKTTEESALRWANMLTTDSKITQKAYKEKLGLDFEYLPSPIDTEKLDDIPDTEKKDNQVIYAGRDSYEKGIDILRRIESQIKGNVVYCIDFPWQKAMSTLKSSRVLVVPSRMESLPTVIKEAFYLKIPVIATNVGGIPELVTNKKTGILVPPEEPQTLLSEINSLLDDSEQIKKLTDAAFDFVNKNMTWTIWLPKYIEFYKKLLK
ncbi:glycosyltransferase family 4 protein [Candidatus Nitrosotenuis aquarius]|uniref:glycosyltransferase family 4 protein n=1 Tax=Candidatus Nitrosotenuis aquarius TaxID=1846278 RepID=UPI000C1EDF31|nr:glycosyltransferase family 4 protein [Candidatus Nitrosotenuis aquarius]